MNKFLNNRVTDHISDVTFNLSTTINLNTNLLKVLRMNQTNEIRFTIRPIVSQVYVDFSQK